MWLLGATRGKQCLTMMDIWSSETFMWSKWVKHLKICLKIQDSLLSPTKIMVARGKTMVNNALQWWTFKVLRLSYDQNGWNTSKYASKFKIPYYHPLRMWLLGGNQRETMPYNDGHLKFWDFHMIKMGETPQNMPQNFDFLLSPTKIMVARGNNR